MTSDLHVARVGMQNHTIGVVGIVDRVAAGAGSNLIVPVIAIENIDSSAAVDAIVSLSAIDGIADGVDSVPAGDRIAPLATVYDVVAGAARNQIVATISVDRVGG